ncbi:hypothetical protein EDC94DRAFT_586229 [Helicostylum pulchrum]|nr:hypothetical protein EDC94DRAFT_586229 [Helicostylum pulchrum]
MNIFLKEACNLYISSSFISSFVIRLFSCINFDRQELDHCVQELDSKTRVVYFGQYKIGKMKYVPFCPCHSISRRPLWEKNSLAQLGKVSTEFTKVRRMVTAIYLAAPSVNCRTLMKVFPEKLSRRRSLTGAYFAASVRLLLSLTVTKKRGIGRGIGRGRRRRRKLLVVVCRETLRPGVLWHVRDLEFLQSQKKKKKQVHLEAKENDHIFITQVEAYYHFLKALSCNTEKFKEILAVGLLRKVWKNFKEEKKRMLRVETTLQKIIGNKLRAFLGVSLPSFNKRNTKRYFY